MLSVRQLDGRCVSDEHHAVWRTVSMRRHGIWVDIETGRCPARCTHEERPKVVVKSKLDVRIVPELETG